MGPSSALGNPFWPFGFPEVEATALLYRGETDLVTIVIGVDLEVGRPQSRLAGFVVHEVPADESCVIQAASPEAYVVRAAGYRNITNGGIVGARGSLRGFIVRQRRQI